MIGIVAVSHSARLGEAALELALQMVRGESARVRVAAGAGTDADGTPILGTDAVAVAGAIDELAADCDGVLVLMDLGSAVLSAELALELRMSDVPVRLAPAPFVEGLLAAVISASAGGSLDAVAAEASAALTAKTGQLGEPDEMPREGGGTVHADTGAEGNADTGAEETAALVRRVRVRNPLGIHARPAALIAEASAGADVWLRRLPEGPEAQAGSLSRLLILGARQGDELELRAVGADAAGALERVSALFDDGFGEGNAEDADAVTGAAAGAAAKDDAPATDATPTIPARTIPAGTTLRGRGVSPGLVAAPVLHLAPALAQPDETVVVAFADRPVEAAAVERAAAAAAEQLGSRAAEASGETRAILDAARMLASDPQLVSEAIALVQGQGRTAARAVWEAAAEQERQLTALGGRTAERATDIRDVRDRIIAEILNIDLPGVPERDDVFVLVAADLAPADTASLEGSKCVALVTEQGGPTSHTAIIARSLGLTAVVGVAGATAIPGDTVVLVDGDRGTVDVDPVASRLADARAAVAAPPFSGTGELADGLSIPLLANVGGAAEAVAAASAHAEGVGLFRTEFCFLGRTDAPSIDEQVTAYRGVLAPFAGRKVVVRTLDAGSDKPLPFANADREDNPALGIRGLRIARRNPQLLDDQLRALALAAAAESTQVEVMAPMVSTVDEAREFADRCRAAGLARVGIMIETPSAALLAPELFEIVDFVSLGTNDLAQYTLAADRLLSELGDLNDPWQPAVLRLIATVGAAGRAAGKHVGVCGEAAGDPALAPVLVGLGVTSLSMAARSLGRVAAALAEVSGEACRRAAASALAAPTADEARAAVAASRRAGRPS
ncbi:MULTISPECIES: phosphoenolpyruvate--protein phosphotransferase [unclassified Microbacterium]|uniref:phosphoenolpyruvate--protein phosphotransferase n=1 Tax=unclassified Microbacterium TaxID=2609290 RepID=UPI000EAA9185|nr:MULTISPECIES: phosphoenolpyruvate--protein phosphotransferase [unclassified Microbacterium]MBT2485189.1 phosphoenolpyruvate--protein phosphotransferase [Microbacterium sp. ISL-108]RKN68021.1 phosphoenolpyruvate--protein phosphotransferase [Microbacterium sp. CGR2]